MPPTETQEKFVADSVILTASGLASLATSSTLVAGYALAAITNRTFLDVAHQLSLTTKVGTTPVTATQIQCWIIKALSFASGTPVWPACFTAAYTGSAGAFTAVSPGILASVGKLIWVGNVDSATSSRVYEGSGLDIPSLYYGNMPSDYFPFFTHNTGVNLDATGGAFAVSYDRIRYTET
jgi:hypothetical protein